MRTHCSRRDVASGDNVDHQMMEFNNTPDILTRYGTDSFQRGDLQGYDGLLFKVKRFILYSYTAQL